MSIARHHAEWLSLLEINGPFLSLETLLAVFPQGLPPDDGDLRRQLRLAYAEWQDNSGGLQPDGALHAAWVRYVLEAVLGYGDETLLPFAANTPARGVRPTQTTEPPQTPETPPHPVTSSPAHPLTLPLPEYGETLAPDWAVIDPDSGEPRLLVQIVPPGQGLGSDLPRRAWKAAPVTRLQTLLYGAGVPLGLVTNGEQWLLVYAPRGGTAGYVTWHAGLWLEEPLTLRAFVALLGAYRCFGVPAAQTLGGLLGRSAADQAQVTTQLGDQVRRAVEILVRAIDVADRDGGLLAGVPETTIYEAALTVMMRLVFLFYAEERGLLPLDDELYAAAYAAAPLSAGLRAAADAYGEEVIERRSDAWRRLLAVFRAVHGGVSHDRLRLPAYGGSLFDPDRFPFLEGRAAGGSWRDTPARPLPINNRTVLHLLEALQLLQVQAPGGERQARRLSFRALDIEQIGHVYEGLLDHTAVRAAAVVLGLAGAGGKEPELPLAALEGRAGYPAPAELPAAALAWLVEQTGRSERALRRAWATPPELQWQARLLAACGGDEELLRRVLPFAGLIRADDLGQPLVILPRSVYVTGGAERRATGTHYTPRSLTEPIVRQALEPLVYGGPAAGLGREGWRLRPASELLALKVCDMAMGSGAFLVQACRYLADRLLEALDRDGGEGSGEDIFAPILAASDPDERTVLVRRLVAERCLYGVDKNPLAVEMAKLSLWLITLDKGRAFNFLDHALKCGDSLVGIHSLEQLRCWELAGSGPRQFGTLELDAAVERVMRLRADIESLPVRDVEDQALKAWWLAEAEAAARDLKRAGDLLAASYYNELRARPQASLRAELLAVAQAGGAEAERRAAALLGDLRPFHWPLEFPEVFLGAGRGGFDAFVGNPPFIGGQRIRGALGGDYLAYLKTRWNHTRGSADLCAYFFLRAFGLLQGGGALGLIATNTIAQGNTRDLGLAHIVEQGGEVFAATNNQPWPGHAAVVVSIAHIMRGHFRGERILDGQPVAHISAMLDKTQAAGDPQPLVANADLSFQGSNVLGLGFTMSPAAAQAMIARNDKNADVLFPYLNGEDLNSHPQQQPSRWVINFFNWPLERSAAGSWSAADERQRREYLRTGIVPSDYPDPVAADYPECLEIVRRDVYPQRMAQNREIRKRYWWRYGEVAPALYAAIRQMKRVLVVAEVSKYVAPVFMPTRIVFSHMTIVFSSENSFDFMLLQSSFHDCWARYRSSSMGGTLRYAPSDIFRTLPFPAMPIPNSNVAEMYHELRRQMMIERQEGLTAIYNRFHNADETAAGIARLRGLHVEMDQAVAAAYGWGDLPLDHGFHATAQGVRYTVSEAARRELLRRLLHLNHERYEQEVQAGLHAKAGAGKGKGAAAGEDQLALL